MDATSTTTPGSAGAVNGAGAAHESAAADGSIVQATAPVGEDRFVLYSQPIVH